MVDRCVRKRNQENKGEARIHTYAYMQRQRTTSDTHLEIPRRPALQDRHARAPEHVLEVRQGQRALPRLGRGGEGGGCRLGVIVVAMGWGRCG